MNIKQQMQLEIACGNELLEKDESNMKNTIFKYDDEYEHSMKHVDMNTIK